MRTFRKQLTCIKKSQSSEKKVTDFNPITNHMQDSRNHTGVGMSS